VYTLQGDEKKALDDHYFATGYKIIPENDKKWMRELESVTFSHAFMKYGAIHWAYDHLSEEQLQILQRFSKVFEQSYTRFLDLQKAEAQAREAQIEAALEKIRSRSLAMHQSKELKEVIAITFEKLNELNVLPGTVAIQLFDKKSMHSVLWVGNTIQDPQMVDLPYDKQMMLEDTLVKDSWQAMIDGVDIVNKEYSVEQKNKYFNFLFSKNSLTQIPEQAREVLRQMQSHIACLFVEKNSAFLVDSWEGQFFAKENLHVLKRAAKVFEQAYIRFLDLQKAEAQAREAQIEAALERVRSRTLAMQKSDELAETAAEVFRQLIALGIEPNRLYIGIVKEETGDMEMWATDEDGTQVGKRFMFNKNENASVLKLYDGWKAQKKSVIVDMQGKELEDYFHYLNNVMHIPFKGGLTQKRRVQSVAYFSKGFIGMASPDGQGDETIQLLERFAAVFNLTFTRFNDLKIAEAHAVQAAEDLVKLQIEKKRAEDALSELQVTQKQLIQSEKMASLGELTAGIAHEIQNPLNFVNNFSDVNKELLLEMKEEIEKGNIEEVKVIANDVISNEEKINHHGKRADAIVKGMLQHSRSSSGVKEPTDINELADEYLRLAYHGLRAKDKSFNATMKTDFDESIGKVSVIPQEIGRVFLNLITNAFYVVAEKKKQLANGYEPTVTVTTKKESDQVVVSVKDNGSGIPQKVLDKIFQPFFTTKPTGQGTGLGLSLSYDIVKAHSGEIKVKTKDGEGSEFVIQLPIDQ
jgi:signal transduction histidine kinase